MATTLDSALPLRTRLAAAAGVVTASLSKQLRRGEGSVIGGRVALALDPRSLERLAGGRSIVLVSGTNGKTTTTSLVAAALSTSGEVVTNAAGANMFGGMVSALSSSDAERAVLEVDEGHLPKALEITGARYVVLLNLSRDQLDRVGEVRMQASKWRDALRARDLVVVANADDPMVVWATRETRSVLWVAGGNNWRLDAASCPECGSRIDWHEEHWACTSCSLRRPPIHVFFGKTSEGEGAGAGEDELPTGAHLRFPLEMKLPGEVNRRNAALALTAAIAMGAEPRTALRAMSQSEGAGGRFTSVTIAGVPVRLILAKNPAGWTEALRIARNDASPLVVAINARVQDGRDPSWLWDVPYETLVGRFVVTTGERGRDLAVRLRYAGVDHAFVEDMAEAVRMAADRAGGNEIDVLGNYSAFQDFRKLAPS